jgi:hypothetical protein
MNRLKNKLILAFCFLLFANYLIAQNTNPILAIKSSAVVSPLEEVVVLCGTEGGIIITDAHGNEYFKSPANGHVAFKAGGAAGKQKITLHDKKGKQLAETSFVLKAETKIDDGGKYQELFDILRNGMFWNGRKGYGEINYQGKPYKFYVPWDLDNNNVLNGMQYFLPYGGENTDLLRQIQRKDGMIWSFIRGGNDGYHYYESAYGYDYFGKEDGIWYVRQPVDNHSDYNFVNQFYKHWRATGNKEWMAQTIASAALALDYCYTDTIRWSRRFQLLKRPYCIDSWDFQVDDEYTPEAPISPSMVVVPGKTKFGVFFGDNTGYYEACNQVSEMYETLGETDKAHKYRERGKAILENLIKVSWNGKFFTHFIDEDPTVKRNLGVDEKSQIAQGNMYSLNRGLPHEMNVAIIKTYMQLKENLPIGSPGEWYAIYPPFEQGFGDHNQKWQYMNGGIAGHAIGELAKGAYENGYENYASDIMSRLYDLGKKYNNKIYFSYTGSIAPAPPAPVFQSIDISKQANMDLCDNGSSGAMNWMGTEKASGNDMRGLPTGKQVFKGIDFNVIDPELNNRKSAIAVSVKATLPREVEVPINKIAGSIYLLHSSSDNVPANVAGGITFIYSDGSEYSQYILKNKDVTNWWFPDLNTERAGVAWSGPNLKSTKVGVCWSAIDNPNPEKIISKLRFSAPLEGGIYTVLGITLADRAFYIPIKGESYGGPDNWAAANGMSALIEGLAGVKNAGLAYDSVIISPRWSTSGVDSVGVVACLEASGAYAAYNYKMDKKNNNIQLYFTSSGNTSMIQMLIPDEYVSVSDVSLNGQTIPYQLKTVGKSVYAICKLIPYQVNILSYVFNK